LGTVGHTARPSCGCAELLLLLLLLLLLPDELVVSWLSCSPGKQPIPPSSDAVLLLHTTLGTGYDVNPVLQLWHNGQQG
jgi:hypothetical protein